MKFSPGDVVPAAALETIHGKPLQLPDAGAR